MYIVLLYRVDSTHKLMVTEATDAEAGEPV